MRYTVVLFPFFDSSCPEAPQEIQAFESDDYEEAVKFYGQAAKDGTGLSVMGGILHLFDTQEDTIEKKSVVLHM